MSLNRRWGCALQIEEACKNDASDGRLDALLASVLHQPKSFKLKLAPDTYNDEQRTKFTFQSAEACDWDVECKVWECCLCVIGQRGLGLLPCNLVRNASLPGASLPGWGGIACSSYDCVSCACIQTVYRLCIYERSLTCVPPSVHVIGNVPQFAAYHQSPQ